MRIEEHEIGIEQVATGMYVCRLDRPWTETPFPLQGFLVGSESQVSVLRRYCSRVWIDLERGRDAPDAPLQTLASPQPRAEALIGNRQYVDSSSVEEEIPLARETLDAVSLLTAKIIDDLRAGAILSPQDVEVAAASIVKSVLRNADAFFLVSAMRKRDAYGYSHAINCGALAAAFGRTLGLPEEILVELASGGLLLDVGKTRLPEALLTHPGPLDLAQMQQARGHVGLSLQILAENGLHGVSVHDMVGSHHERCDGSGYPDGLKGTFIPMFARMAAIIDSFDAMTSDRPHAPAMPRHDALQSIYRERGALYQAELVEQFISCLGVYPTGSLVELRTGEVAVVMAQNPARRLRPRVMLLTDADKHLRTRFESLDLMLQPDDLSPQMDILRPLPLGAHGLDPSELYL
ncbi:MAG: HD-GYP domain-containing protein [Luteimonas sp.]